MMLIGHSIAQRVHLIHRSSSRRNMPRKRSEGTFFCSGYWIVTFFLKRWRPVTDRPSKMSSSVIRSSQFFRAIGASCRRRPAHAGWLGREPIAPRQRSPELGEQEEEDEESAVEPREHDHAGRTSRPQKERRRHEHDIRQ